MVCSRSLKIGHLPLHCCSQESPGFFFLFCFWFFFCLFLFGLWVIRYGVLFLPPIQAVFRPPLESACYHDPISNLLPPPLSPLLSLLLLPPPSLSCSGHRLSSSSPLPSNNVCIHVPKETPTGPQTHSHARTNAILWASPE